MFKINTALVLCAGYGKRLNPLTLKNPKPLLKLNDLTLLENTINLIKKLGISDIKLNTFYLKDQIKIFIEQKNFDVKIEIIEDGDKILDTGGGILNMTNSLNEKDFLVFNPDTLWTIDYKETINDMIKVYFENKMENLLMVVNKVNSYDQRFKGDFELKQKVLLKDSDNNYIYTGCQIINKKLFNDMGKNKFSILEIWNSQMNKKKLYGHEYEGKFIHLTDLEIFNQLTKNQ